MSEGSVARASDGALVAALRTVQEPGFPSYNDHWRRITIARSLDDGLTWVDREVYFRSGKVHSDLITLADGCGSEERTAKNVCSFPAVYYVCPASLSLQIKISLGLTRQH